MSRWNVERALAAVAGQTDALEEERREILAKRAKGTRLLVMVGGGAIALGLLILSISAHIVGLFFALVPGLIACLIIHNVYFVKGARRYQAVFKTRILSAMVKAVEPGMNYLPEQGISEAMFVQSGLFGTRPDRYSCEDLFHGMIGKTKVMFSEVHAEDKRTRRDSDGKTKTYWVTIFRGIFFTADFHKHFRSPLSVMPDVAERHLGWIGKKLQKIGGGVQRLENPEFEKRFVVRGNDPVEARYILTPSMQEQLVALGQRVGNDLRVVFRESQVCLAIPSSDNLFEGNLHKPAGDRDQAARLLSELQSCFVIVDELDLNTRIWTKE